MTTSPPPCVASIKVCSEGVATPAKACDKDPLWMPLSMAMYMGADMGLRLRARDSYLRSVVMRGTRSCKVAPRSK